VSIVLIGTPGAAPRLMLPNPSPGLVDANLGDGEVCVEVETIGAWMITAEGTGAEPVAPVLANLIRAALADVDVQAESVRGEFITAGSGQAMTYLRKEAEAREWLADPASETPFLSAEAAATGVTLANLAAAVVARADAWEVVGPRIEAARIAGKQAIAAATSATEVEAAAQIDWAAVVNGGI